jgi:hypothetical protein
MAATASTQLHLALAQLRLSRLDTQLQPGERCIASVLGLPAPGSGITATITWSVHELPSGTALSEGGAFHAENGLNGAGVALRFRPEVVELLTAAPAPIARRLRAKVVLSAGQETAARTLVADVDVFALRVPSLLALFRNAGFSAADDGAALLVAPGSSPLTSLSAAVSAVESLHAAAQALSVFARFATLAARVNTLVNALHAHPAEHVRFVRTDALANLNTITLIQRGPLANDIEAEDELSSLILLGPAARRARLFIRRDFDQTAGRLDVGVEDENIVLISNLDAKHPSTVPAGRAQVIVAPTGTKTFSNELSSLQLAKPAFRSTLTGEATLTIEHPQFGGSDTVDIEVGLAFNASHRSFTVDSFPPVTVSGVVVSLVGAASGTFDPATGAMTLTLRLLLDTALGNPEIPFALTGTVDLDTGAVTLSGSSAAEGAPIGGAPAQLVISGTLDPIP